MHKRIMTLGILAFPMAFPMAFPLAMGGCRAPGDSVAPVGRSVAKPPVKISPPSNDMPIANWRANATVVSVTNGSHPACGWGTTLGVIRDNVDWRIDIQADSIALYEDMHNYPTDETEFYGKVDSARIVASSPFVADYAASPCQFREAHLTGSFTSDSTFEAVETNIWGTPGTETTVVRHWLGWRL